LLHVDTIAHNTSGIAYQEKSQRPETRKEVPPAAEPLFSCTCCLSRHKTHPTPPCLLTCLCRFLAAKHHCLRPLGKCSLAELGLANGSLHLAAGPVAGNSCSRPPPLSPGVHGALSGGGLTGGAGAGGNSSCWGGLPGTPPSHSHMPSIPSSPKPPLGRSSLDLNPGGVSERGAPLGGSILGSSPVGDSPILGLQMGGSGGLVGSYNSSGGAGEERYACPHVDA
jgi:hypothetical protein